MKRKQNIDLPTTTSSDKNEQSSQEINAEELDQASGGSRSRHRHWSDWSRWN